MSVIIGGIFAELVKKYQNKWAHEKEEKDWTKWEECEEMRKNMGHTTSIEKIPKSFRRSRNKHRH